MALPDTIVRNDDIAARLGVTADWIETRTGIQERRVAQAGQRVEALAAAAGREALERSELSASEIDLVLVATMTADEVTPNTAPLVATQLGAGRAGAIDLGAACTGFLSGLSVAAASVETGRADTVLLIGAEAMTRIVNPDDRGTAAVFADGAGAAVVTAARGEGSIGPIVLRADGTGGEWLWATHAERQLHMQGQETFVAAVQCMTEVTLETVARAGIELDDVDLFVYHQANARIISRVGERLGLDSDRVFNCIARYGNTSAASLPIALADASRSGALRDGDLVLLATFGAGFNWGGGLVTWAG